MYCQGVLLTTALCHPATKATRNLLPAVLLENYCTARLRGCKLYDDGEKRNAATIIRLA